MLLLRPLLSPPSFIKPAGALPKFGATERTPQEDPLLSPFAIAFVNDNSKLKSGLSAQQQESLLAQESFLAISKAITRIKQAKLDIGPQIFELTKKNPSAQDDYAILLGRLHWEEVLRATSYHPWSPSNNLTYPRPGQPLFGLETPCLQVKLPRLVESSLLAKIIFHQQAPNFFNEVVLPSYQAYFKKHGINPELSSEFIDLLKQEEQVLQQTPVNMPDIKHYDIKKELYTERYNQLMAQQAELTRALLESLPKEQTQGVKKQFTKLIKKGLLKPERQKGNQYIHIPTLQNDYNQLLERLGSSASSSEETAALSEQLSLIINNLFSLLSSTYNPYYNPKASQPSSSSSAANPTLLPKPQLPKPQRGTNPFQPPD